MGGPRKNKTTEPVQKPNLPEDFVQYSKMDRVSKLDILGHKMFGKVKRHDPESIWVFVKWEDKTEYWVGYQTLKME